MSNPRLKYRISAGSEGEPERYLTGSRYAHYFSDTREYYEKTLRVQCFTVLNSRMRMVLERTVLTVTRHDGVWCVEHDGDEFGHSTDKEIAKAAANRRAREVLDGGRPCEVRISGEHGFWAS